jgi:hypothetical protein
LCDNTSYFHYLSDAVILIANFSSLLLHSQGGWKHLKDDIALMGADNPFSQLVWPLSGEDPDDAFSGVPYEKVASQC